MILNILSYTEQTLTAIMHLHLIMLSSNFKESPNPFSPKFLHKYFWVFVVYIHPYYSKCASYTSNIRIAREIVRKRLSNSTTEYESSAFQQNSPRLPVCTVKLKKHCYINSTCESLSVNVQVAAAKIFYKAHRKKKVMASMHYYGLNVCVPSKSIG